MPSSAIPAITAGIGLAGTLFGGKGKKTQYTQGLSPQAQGVSNQMAQYIQGGMRQPIQYANVNPMQIQAMDMISRMFTGKPYTQPQYGVSGQYGGPTGPQNPQIPQGQYLQRPSPFPGMQQPSMGMPGQIPGQMPGPMPPQMGPQYYGPQRVNNAGLRRR